MKQYFIIIKYMYIKVDAKNGSKKKKKKEKKQSHPTIPFLKKVCI